MRFVATCATAAPTCRSSSRSPACTTCRTRSPRSRSGARSACADAAIAQRARRVQGRRPALPAPRRRRARRRRHVHADRRLRPSSGRDGGRRSPRRAAAFPDRRLVLAFQPHRYTRTRDLFEDFVARAVDASTRWCWPMSTRPARRRSSRPTAARSRARCASPARSSRCSSRASATSPTAMRAHRARRRRRAHDGRRARSARCAAARSGARMMMAEPLALHGAARHPRRATRRSRATRAGAPAAAADARCIGRPDRDDLAAFVRQLPRVARRCSCSGLGSNTLVRDGGVRGAVVVLHDPGAALAVADGLIYAEAGVASPKLARLRRDASAARTPSSWRASPARSAARSR